MRRSKHSRETTCTMLEVISNACWWLMVWVRVFWWMCLCVGCVLSMVPVIWNRVMVFCHARLAVVVLGKKISFRRVRLCGVGVGVRPGCVWLCFVVWILVWCLWLRWSWQRLFLHGCDVYGSSAWCFEMMILWLALWKHFGGDCVVFVPALFDPNVLSLWVTCLWVAVCFWLRWCWRAHCLVMGKSSRVHCGVGEPPDHNPSVALAGSKHLKLKLSTSLLIIRLPICSKKWPAILRVLIAHLQT